MDLWRFSFYTVIGSYLWCLALAWAGMKLGEHWRALAPYLHRFNDLVAVLIVLGVAVFLYSRLRGANADSVAVENAR